MEVTQSMNASRRRMVSIVAHEEHALKTHLSLIDMETSQSVDNWRRTRRQFASKYRHLMVKPDYSRDIKIPKLVEAGDIGGSHRKWTKLPPIAGKFNSDRRHRLVMNNLVLRTCTLQHQNESSKHIRRFDTHLQRSNTVPLAANIPCSDVATFISSDTVSTVYNCHM